MLNQTVGPQSRIAKIAFFQEFERMRHDHHDRVSAGVNCIKYVDHLPRSQRRHLHGTETAAPDRADIGETGHRQLANAGDFVHPPVTANSRSGGGATAMQIFEENRNPASRMAWKTDRAVEKLPVRIALGRCPVQLLI